MGAILVVMSVAVILFLVFGFVYLAVRFYLLACVSTPLQTWTNVGGLDFAYVQVDCDTLAKTFTHELQVGVHGSSRRDTIFVVEPADFNLVPSIAVENGTIDVDLSAVDDIMLEKSDWRGRPIRYNIGHIRYPNGLTPDDLKLHLK
jgi:hypothetical protein